MIRKLLFMFLLSVAFLLGLLYALPSAWLQLALPPFVQLNTPTGTIWQGSAQLLLQAEQAQALPHRIHWQWRLKPWPEVELRSQHFTQPIYLRWHGNGWRLSQGSVQLPASTLHRLHPLLSTLKPEGQLSLDWPTLHLGEVGASVTLHWRQASTAISPIKPLGNYQAEVQWQPLQWRLSTETGPLFLEGHGQAQAGQGFVFSGSASASGSELEQLSDLLRFLGPVEQGRVKLQLQSAY